MPIACGTIRVWKPANIVATSLTFIPVGMECDEPCDVTVTVTWTNTGGRTGTFVPNISVDGTPITPIYPSEDLTGGASITHAFTVSGLSAGAGPYLDHTICPVPS